MPVEEYSIPAEAEKLLLKGIIDNKLHWFLPPEIKEIAKKVEYVGSTAPVIPVSFRFAESISAIKGFQGSMLNLLLNRKYETPYQKIVINTDHAQLFIMSVLLPVIDPNGAKVRVTDDDNVQKYFPDCDIHGAFTANGSFYDKACTNIYKTKDDRFYHLHASLNPSVCKEALGMPSSIDVPDIYAANKLFQEAIAKYDAADIENMMNDRYRQAGTICWSKEEYFASEHGKANSHVGLYELHHFPNKKQQAGWWTPIEGKTGPNRPLSGLKVVDLTRIIASPTIGRELAELGASVMRITSPNISDFSSGNVDLGWGKWNAHLDLTKEEDREKLKSLIEESDVVIDGYRPGVMKKWGFGKEDILALFDNKDQGIIYVHENSYGWNGPWSYRAGWQQISDANCGSSLAFGQAMGLDEPVTPVFPNTDFCTGAAGSIGVLNALIKRAEDGGSFVVDVALNYYSQWLINSCKEYPPDVWKALRERHGNPVFHHTDNMTITLPIFTKMLLENGAQIFNPQFFEDRENKALGVPIRTVKPILQFPEGLVTPGYNVGSRPNGVDKPKWPKDLLNTEIVT